MMTSRDDLPLVMLPGSMCDHRLFEHQFEAFGPGVILGDLTKSSSIEEMADDVLALAPARFALAGLSLGGIVAAEIAARAPERLLGVAVMDTNLAMPDSQQLERRTAWAQRVRAGEFASVLADELVVPMTKYAEIHGSLVFDMAFGLGPSIFLQQNEALLHRRDRRDDLASLQVPVLVACGGADDLCSPMFHRQLAARTPGAELVVIEDAGHLATIDQPREFTSALDSWLSHCSQNTTIHKGKFQ